MKRTVFYGVAMVFLFACNEASKDSVQKADSANDARNDSSENVNSKAVTGTDEASAEFLVRALDAGLMETDMGSTAWQKAKLARVRDFGGMMVSDNELMNAKIRNLAAARSVTLPGMTSDKMSKIIRGLSEKKSGEFDRAYINSMAENQKNEIHQYEAAAKDVKDTAVRSFIIATIPVLKKHLDSCLSIQMALAEGNRKQ